MAVGQRAGSVLGPIQKLFGRGSVSGLSEGQLLARFVGEHDEVAFEAIVSRHGPMVLGICRRLLDDPNDVEDAFQATFLVLVRRAGSLRDRELLSNWLYGVALRVASRARRDRARRRVGQVPDFHSEDQTGASPDDAGLCELRSVLDTEVARLPERFRAPIVLCYFEGLTHDQAAERLRCPVGTVRSRMAKGRELLQSRLTRRGFGPASLVPAGPLPGLSPAIPPALLTRTAAAAGAVATGSLLAGGGSTSAVALARGVLRTMTFTKWMTIAAATVALVAVGGGVRVAARPDGADETEGQPENRPAGVDGRPVRKALEEIQSGINRYEEQLAAERARIAAQRDQIAALTDRIRALEAAAKAEAARSPAPLAGRSQPAAANPPGAAAPPGSENPRIAADRLIVGAQALAAISGSKDRVVIYATGRFKGRSRTYRVPHGMTGLSVTFHGDNIMIVANKPGAAHLASYNLASDRWALQDLRGVAGGHVSVPNEMSGMQDPRATQFLLPCLYHVDKLDAQGVGPVELAVFDVGRGTWIVQHLLEPADSKWLAPYVQGNVAVYVIGRHVYAYSADAGCWATLSLEEPLFSGMMPPPAMMPTPGISGSPLYMNDSMTAVSQHGRLHIFTAKTGRWETINPKD
jgi:RNA polymerase sigma factor (sigma-70 family)